MKSEEVILQHLQIGDLRIRVWFEVVDDLAVKLLPVVYQQVCPSFFTADCKLVPWHSRTVDILIWSLKTHEAVLFVSYAYATAPADGTRGNELAAKPVTLPPCLHTPVMVSRTSSDILVVEPRTLHGSRASLQVAKGIIQVTLANYSMC